jgi:hypothetical protein
VKIASSGYFSSLCHIATERFYAGQIEYEAENVRSARTGQPMVRVHYYTRSHRGSTSYWKEGEGELCLEKVGRHLAGVQALGFWSANGLVQERFGLLLQGKRISPRQAGTNSYRHSTSCAVIYSNKSQSADEPILKVFGLTKDEIARAREIEDIQQFVMRGAIRSPEFGGEYDIYLYDLYQAEAVRDFLTKGGFANVRLEPVEEAGIMDVERPKAGRKPVQVDERTKAERTAERRKKDAERKKRARSAERRKKERDGSLRPVGRPRGRTANDKVTAPKSST